MKRILPMILMAFLLLFTACGTPSETASPATASESYPQPSYPEPDSDITPTFAEINAPLVDHPQIASLSMLSETDGWAVTDQAVVRTADGGTTWYNVSPPNIAGPGYGFSHAFLDALHGFVVVPDADDQMHKGTLYRTDDGGLHWTSVSVPFGSGDLHFLDLQNGWAMVSLGVGAGSNAIAVFQTTDGGATWTRTFVNDPNVEGATASIPLGGLKNGFAARDMKTAWIGGVVYSDNTVYVFRSDDGGHSWAQVSLPTPSNLGSGGQLGFIGLQFFNNFQDAFLELMASSSDTPQLLVFVSHDRGDSWSLTPTGIPNGRKVDFASAQDGFVFNGQQFYVTHDAAQTWMAITPDINFGDSLGAMDFVDATTGWVTSYDMNTSQTLLYKTTDGGATWTSQ